MAMKPFDRPIYVSQPFLPPLASFVSGLKEIWESRWLTNRGPVLKRFETKLTAYFSNPNVSVFTNGGLALQIAIQGLRLQGEVITTPFTFAATGNALAQNGLTPVFADIEPRYWGLDPERVEALITPHTSAILAVHVFGNPCRTADLERIAARHGLKVIYDAAHAFGSTINGRPIAGFGDVSMFSFHATKPFHTFEGGALVFKDAELKPVFDALSNHGLQPDGDVPLPGLNAKMTELQALMGELMLSHLPDIIAHGRDIQALYRQRLALVPGVTTLAEPELGIVPNHAFMPVVVDRKSFGMSRDELLAALAQYNVHARRYFYPLMSNMKAFAPYKSKDPLREANRVGQSSLSLPTYADLPLDDVNRICDLISGIRENRRGAND